MNYRKALVDYPIGPYLRHMSPPSVLFLNLDCVQSDWENYRARAHGFSSARKCSTCWIVSHPTREQKRG